MAGYRTFLPALFIHSVFFIFCVNGGNMPVSHSVSAGYWSDKLALKPYREYLSLGTHGHLQRLAAQLLVESFDVAGISAEDASRRITNGIKGGISIYGNSQLTMFDIMLHTFSTSVSTSLDIRTDIPEAPFLLLFSEDEGLRRGTNLPLTHLGAQMRIYTDATFQYNQSIKMSGMMDKVNSVLSDVTDFEQAEWSGGITLSLGHLFLAMRTTAGGIHLDDDGSELYVDANAEVVTSGCGINGSGWPLLTLQAGVPISGLGAGITSGIRFYGEKTRVRVGVSNIGPMLWNNVRKSTVVLRTRNMTAADLLSDEFDVFDPKKGGVFPTIDSSHDVSPLWSLMPARVTMDCGYRVSFKNSTFRMLTEYVEASLEYEQYLAAWPGHSYIPEFTVGVENGFLQGVLPVLTGCMFGGTKGIASLIAIDVRLGKVQLQGGYEAVGTPYLYPKRGCAVYLGLSSGWGRGQ